MVVILGRTGRTEFSFPATIAAVVDERGPQPGLVPSHGIVGAGLALVGSYVIVLVLMYAFTQRLFPVPYEWRRLALVAAVRRGAGGRRRALLPTAGCDRPAEPNGVLWLAYPAVLFLFGFLHDEERSGLAELLRPSAIAARARGLRAATADPGARRTSRADLGPEVYEAVARDEDRSGT